MGGDDLIRLQEEHEAEVELAIEAGFLERCDYHEDCVLDCELGDDEDAFERAEALGLSRERVQDLVNEHGTECVSCAKRDAE